MKDYLTSKVVEYYDSKLKIHGPNHKGVDWNSIESQSLRFNKILKLIKNKKTRFSLLDFGCGYGALYHYMNELYNDFHYSGFDISTAMINKAKEMNHKYNCVWYTSLNSKTNFDYVVSSGTFNVKVKFPDREWKLYILNTLDKINSISTKGFSFNMLSNSAEKEKRKEKLYYADPTYFLDYCLNYYSKQTELLNNYSLYEFTIIVRK
tara:strand:- start:152 stop:772 length:621 start_codon:yes stop_codon:yes gene_type:complete